MNKSYSVLIDYSPAYELVASFYTYVLKKDLKTLSLPGNWRDDTRRKLPDAFALELEDERWEVLHRIVLLIAQCPDKASVDGFLHWLAHLPPGELYERLSPWVSSIPLNLGEIRDRSVYLLSSWNEHYFNSVDAAILRQLQESAEAKKAQLASCPPIDLIEQSTNGIRIEPTENLQQVILVPQYHNHPLTILDFYRGMATCMYPVTSMPDESAFTVLQLSHCLADENRLHILRFLVEKERTLGEIHQHMGLAKSTVHHHLSTLRRAGAIRSHYIDNSTPACYSLRENFIDGLHAALNHFLQRRETPRD